MRIDNFFVLCARYAIAHFLICGSLMGVDGLDGEYADTAVVCSKEHSHVFNVTGHGNGIGNGKFLRPGGAIYHGFRTGCASTKNKSISHGRIVLRTSFFT